MRAALTINQADKYNLISSLPENISYILTKLRDLTFWQEKDRGRRLDHMWASPDLARETLGHRFVEETRRWDQPSDHIPLITDFAL